MNALTRKKELQEGGKAGRFERNRPARSPQSRTLPIFPSSCSILFFFLLALTASHARAEEDAGPADAAAPQQVQAQAQVGGCVETVPSGAQRPVLKESFPTRGLSGYAATLTVVVDHGKGETVLARGLEFQSQSEAARTLKSAGFNLPNQDGGAGAHISQGAPDSAKPDRAVTILDLPLVMLPPEPGRHTLTLPPLPIAVSRASGEIATVCTASHTIVVEDPISSTPDAKPLPNPAPRPQREEWTSLKRGLGYAAVGIAAGALLAYLVWWYRRRPKPVPPPPPPRPAWEVAIEKLDEVRHAGLLEVGRFGEYFDRVNDVIRSYLGSRYGFDGLESTTDETLAALTNAQLQQLSYAEVVAFLQECDLVKFANVVPSPDECARALDAGERIVRATTPHLAPLPAPAASPAAPAPASKRDGAA